MGGYKLPIQESTRTAGGNRVIPINRSAEEALCAWKAVCLCACLFLLQNLLKNDGCGAIINRNVMKCAGLPCMVYSAENPLFSWN